MGATDIAWNSLQPQETYRRSQVTVHILCNPGEQKGRINIPTSMVSTYWDGTSDRVTNR